jgi:hypothetical protein
VSIHDGFLELAAAAIDFDLSDYERAELDRHIAECDDCKRTAAAYRDDAAAIAAEAGPSLSPGRSVAILADVLRPPKRSPRPRNVAAGIVVLAIGAVLAVAGASSIRSSKDSHVATLPSVGVSSAPGPSSAPTPGLTDRSGLTPQRPAGTPRPAELPSAVALPVRASGQELGTRIRLAPGGDDDLYVSIPMTGSKVLVTLLDSTGHSRAGWPIVLNGTTSCERLLPVDDGSVRLLCTLENRDGAKFDIVRAYAFDSGGDSLAGWPIDLDLYGADGSFAGRVIGDELTVLAWKSLGDQIAIGQPAGNAWLVRIAADGSVRGGARIAYGTGCCSDTWAVGPDGVVYGTVHYFTDTRAGARSELVAIGPAGVAAGFPVAIDGSASEPVTDGAGRIHVTVGTPGQRPTRMLVFDATGRTVEAGSAKLEIASTSEFIGIEGTGDIPVAPLVGRDGTTFVADLSGGTTTVGRVSPSGQITAGWPYRSDLRIQDTGVCSQGDVCEGSTWAAPADGPDNVLYLLHAASSSSAGGSIVAVGEDGVVVAGWPVGLKRPGSEVWSIVVAPNGTVSALTVEPEPNGSHSATIVTLAPDSTVLYTATVVEP